MLKGQEQFVNQVGAFWDGWLTNVKAVQNFQDDLQKKSLQVFSQQKELLDFSVKALQTVEQQAKSFSQDWNDKLTSNLKLLNGKNEFSEQLNNVRNLNEQVQELSWNSSHTMLDVFVESQNHLEETIKKTLVIQQEKNTENLEKIEVLTEQLKQTQISLLQPIKA